MRSLLLPLLAVIVGGAMVAGGVWGLYDTFTDDDDSTASGATNEMKASSASDCSAVAEHDPRFRLPRGLQFVGEGTAIDHCRGNDVSFTISVSALKDRT